MAGGAVSRACQEIARRAAEIGAWLLKTDTDQVSVRDGQVIGPAGSVTLREIARIWYLRPQDLPAHVNPGGLEATAGYKPARDSGTFSYGAHAALVAVDPEIGDVEILDYVIVEDGGKLVNPMVVDGQIYGGAGARHRHGALRGNAVRRIGPASGLDLRRLSACPGRPRFRTCASSIWKPCRPTRNSA